MAVDKKISQLTSLAQVDVSASTDVLPIVDTSATETKKITVSALVGAGATAGISGAVLTNGTINSTTIGATTPSTGSFTTLTTSSTVTLNGGTANGVLYLNGSKVATSGSALTFDGAKFSNVDATDNNQVAALFHKNVTGGANSGVQVHTNGTDAGGGAYALSVSSGNTPASPTNSIIHALVNSNVGIATSSPATRLHVKGSAGGTDPAVVTGERVRIQSNDTTGRSTYMSLIAGTAANSGVLFGDQDAADVGQIRYLHSDNSMQFYTSSAERMRLDTSGNLLVGTTSSGQGRLMVKQASSSVASGIAVQATSNDSYLGLWNNGSVFNIEAYYNSTGSYQPIAFRTSNTERARITAGGYFKASNSGTYVNSTGSYHEFRSDIDGAVLVVYNPNTGANVTNIYSELPSGANAGAYHFGAVVSGSGYQFTVDKDGDVKNTNNSYGSISDIKLKQDIVDAESQWEDIKNLRVRKYRFKNKPDEALQIGVIAQELEQISPGLVEESVDRDKDGNNFGTTTKSVKYSVLYMKSVKALQEAMARIEQLEAKVAVLENK